MAVDRISDHYTSAKNYSDIDGHLKTFTFIDHDKKATIAASSVKEDLSSLKKAIKESKDKLIMKLLEYPASLCPFLFQNYVIRGEGNDKILWNKKMLMDEGMSIEKIRDICTVIENKIELEKIIL